MVKFKNGTWTIFNEIDYKAITGLSVENEFVKIQLKNNWLDVSVSKTDRGSTRCLFRELVNKDLDIAEIISYLGIEFV